MLFENLARIGKKLAFIKKKSPKSNLTAKIVTLLNLETIFGFILEFKNIPNYPDKYTISAMHFIWGIYWSKLGKDDSVLKVLILTL